MFFLGSQKVVPPWHKGVRKKGATIVEPVFGSIENLPIDTELFGEWAVEVQQFKEPFLGVIYSICGFEDTLTQCEGFTPICGFFLEPLHYVGVL